MTYSNTAISDESMTCRLSVVKGRNVNRVSLVRFSVPGESFPSHDHPSPFDLWRRWVSMPDEHPRLFALDCYPVQ